MILISYSNVPSICEMPENTITFKDRFFLHGDDDDDILNITFDHVNSLNWEFIGEERRALPVERSGFHSKPDGLVFKLKDNRQRVPETFQVQSTARLTSGNGIMTILTIRVV